MLREPFIAPAQELQYQKRNKIAFKHPAYRNQLGGNTLFSLWAWDLPNGGLHHGTALLACILVARNATNGYLSNDEAGLERVGETFDDILPLRPAYYFHVPYPDMPSSSDCDISSTTPPAGTLSLNPYKYPIYAKFDHWRYPHDTRNFPPWMQQMINSVLNESQQLTMGTPAASATTAAVLARDRTCLLTGECDSLDRAHICPRNAQEWFHKNNMQQYNDRQDLSGDGITDDLANALTMSSGRHRAFDAGQFVLVYKYGAWVAHFMEVTAHYASQHHDRLTRLPHNVAPQFLLARFAWTLFPRIKNFLEAGVPRLVRVQEKNAISGEFEEVDKLLSKEDMAAILQIGRGRSSSPKKRHAPDGADDGVESPEEAVKVSLLDQADSPLRASSVVDSAHAWQKATISPEFKQAEPIAAAQTSPPLLERHSPRISTITSVPRLPKRQRRTSDEEEDEQRRFSALRAAALRRSRPSNPQLLCCDYNAAEKARVTGQPGREEFGGGHLCMECLGLEIRHEDDDAQFLQRYR